MKIALTGFHPSLAVTIVTCCLAGISPALPAQGKAALVARFDAVAADSSLNVEGLKPWHLKLEVQLFDPQGANPVTGTIEEWWASREKYRVTYVLPSLNLSELHVPGGAFRTKGSATEPTAARDLLQQVVDPVPLQEKSAAQDPELRKQNFAGVDLECIMMKLPGRETSAPPLGLFPTYCLDPGSPHLRATMEFGSPTFSATGWASSKDTMCLSM